jgi:hypothetical protein
MGRYLKKAIQIFFFLRRVTNNIQSRHILIYEAEMQTQHKLGPSSVYVFQKFGFWIRVKNRVQARLNL